MISRAHMRRQLRAKGGITDVVQRTNYLFGGIKDRIRKLIPNEIADVAVKAAPLVAMIPGQQGTAALMRGIGRFDQRGSISDALKQGALTYAGGKLFGAGMEKIGLRDPGASGIGEFFNEGTRSKAGSLFSRQTTDSAFKKPNIKDITDGSKSLLSGTRDLIKSGFKALPKGVAAQLAAGGITAGASLLASYFQGDFREQEPGETMEEYLAARKVAVGKQMRTYMDNYYANDPEYSALDDAGRDMFVARYNVKDGGRIGYQTGGISSANTLAQNIARNRAAQSAFQQSIAPAQEAVRQRMRGVPEQRTTQAQEPGILSQLGNQAKNYLSKQLTTEKLIPGLQPSIDNLQNIIDSSTDQNDYFRKSTSDMIQKLSEGYGKAPIVGPLNQALIETTAPVLSAVTSPFYDGYEAYKRMEPGSGISGFAKAFDDEQPLDAIANRFIGAAEPLANRITNVGTSIGEGVYNLLNSEADKERQAEIEALDFENNPQNYQSNPDESGYKSLLSRLGQKDVDILVPGESFEDSQTRQKQQAMNTRQKINQEFQDYLDKQGYQKYLSDREIYQSAPAIMERENKLKEELNRLAALDTDVAEDFGFANILNDPNYRKEMTGYTVDRERGQTPVYRNLSPEALQEKLSSSLENVFNQYGVFNNQFRKDPLTSGQYSTLRNQLEDLKKYGNVDPKYSERIDYIMPESFSNIEDIRRRLDPNRARFNTRDPSKRFDYGDVEFKQGSGLTLPSEFYKDILDRSQGLPSQFQGYGKNLLKQLQAMKSGGRVGLMGGAMPTGIMRSNQAGVMERDYRDKGGFVPVGIKEKADDVPAMLSKNEFVMTANAVRGAGNGSIEKGAQRMYDTMKRLEKRAV